MIDQIAYIRGVTTFFSLIPSVKSVDEFALSLMKMELDPAPGESRGYWKYHTPESVFKQVKAVGEINHKKATILFDSSA